MVTLFGPHFHNRLCVPLPFSSCSIAAGAKSQYILINKYRALILNLLVMDKLDISKLLSSVQSDLSPDVIVDARLLAQFDGGKFVFG